MYGFSGFDDFRVGAWMTEGVINTLAEAEKFVGKVAKKATSAIAGALVVASVISVSATAGTNPVIPAVDHVVSSVSSTYEQKAVVALEAELDSLGAKMTEALGRLEKSEKISINPDFLALAELALVASDNRQGQSPLAIAEAFFSNID
jgi:hypothetical protein